MNIDSTLARTFQSKNINDYKLVLEGLVDDFSYNYYHTILCWCDIISAPGPFDKRYWQVWLVECDGKNVGICGLFSHKEDSNEELWLGWFGFIPEYRNKKLGVQVLKFMEIEAKTLGCKKIMSYVDKEGKPLSFYHRNGYENLCSVKEYLEQHPEASEDDFEDVEDYVILKCL